MISVLGSWRRISALYLTALRSQLQTMEDTEGCFTPGSPCPVSAPDTIITREKSQRNASIARILHWPTNMKRVFESSVIALLRGTQFSPPSLALILDGYLDLFWSHRQQKLTWAPHCSNTVSMGWGFCQNTIMSQPMYEKWWQKRRMLRRTTHWFKTPRLMSQVYLIARYRSSAPFGSMNKMKEGLVSNWDLMS